MGRGMGGWLMVGGRGSRYRFVVEAGGRAKPWVMETSRGGQLGRRREAVRTADVGREKERRKESQVWGGGGVR